MLANQLLHTRTALFLFVCVFVFVCVCVFDFVCKVSSTELQSDLCKSCRKKASHRVHIKVISTVLKLKVLRWLIQCAKDVRHAAAGGRFVRLEQKRAYLLSSWGAR